MLLNAIRTPFVAVLFGSTMLFVACRPARVSTVPPYERVRDADGNYYFVETIEGQKWLSSDLRTKRFCNGDPIPGPYAWSLPEKQPWYSPPEGERGSILYNGSAVMDERGICPCGWRVASHEDWLKLEFNLRIGTEELSSSSILNEERGRKSKVGASLMGSSEEWGETRFETFYRSGFDARPTGLHRAAGMVSRDLRDNGGAYWWTSTFSSGTEFALGIGRSIEKGNAGIDVIQANEKWGLAVRCVLDDSTNHKPPVVVAAPSITDIDGNRYKVIDINGIKWMAQNLRTSRFRNGDLIPKVVDKAQWGQVTHGAWCNPGNSAGLDSLGKLYNGYAVRDPRRICPEGWRVPTDDDWSRLELALGISYSELPMPVLRFNAEARGAKAGVGNALKASAPAWDGLNRIGFSGKPTGIRKAEADEDFVLDSTVTAWWSSTFESDDSTIDAFQMRLLVSSFEGIVRPSWEINRGACVRCIQ
jgi:uncharacterized protein (TIGR02145 family)